MKTRNSVAVTLISLFGACIAAYAQPCGAAWTRVLDGQPPVRRYHAAAYDATRQRVMLFGGEGNTTFYTGLGGSNRVLGDTWEWDGTRWRLGSMGFNAVGFDQPVSLGPTGYYGAAMAYRPSRGKVVADGGAANANASNGLNQLWEWDGTTWTQLGAGGAAPGSNGGSSLANHGMVFAPASNTLICTTGNTSLKYLGTTGWNFINGTGFPTPSVGIGSVLAPFERTASLDSLVFVNSTRSATSPTFVAYVNSPPSSTFGWSQLQGTTPQPRQYPKVAFDSARSRLVLYGGLDPSNLGLSDTWEWRADTRVWEQLPGGGPGPRAFHAMAQDLARGVSVLIGGVSSFTDATTAPPIMDVWEWNGTAWTNRTPDEITPRMWHAMAYDPATHRTVLFGGVDARGGLGNVGFETWTYDGTRWTRLAPSAGGPGPRFRHAMTFDPSRGRVVMYGGGWNGVNNVFTGYGDFWELDGDTWREIVTTGPNPGSRRGHGLVYDSARQKLVVIGGQVDGISEMVWEFDGTSWTARPGAGPWPRRDFGCAFDAARSRVVLFGGVIDSLNQSARLDTWEWDGMVWSRVLLSTPDASMGGRTSPFMAYDSSRQRAVLFGGANLLVNGGVRYSDAWEWTGQTWAHFNLSGPRHRGGGAMVYDADRSRFVLFGGDINYRNGGNSSSGPQEFGDTWELQLSDYAPAVVQGHPMGQRIVPPGSSVSFIGDAVSGSGLTFQWLRGSTPLTDDAHLTGSTTATLTITNLSAADTGNYLFRALNGCGSSQTFVGGITVRCPADVTGPTPGTPDGGVTLDDLLYYIDLFTQGVAGADVDDGSRTGTLDRGVTIEDLLWYLARYDIGC